MLFSDSYFAITSLSEGVLKEKGSKFLAYAYPVKTESDIKSHLARLKKEHPSANHHCYAWRLGADKTAYRANDDGEPSNTAGKPILSQLQAKDLTNILLVVIRYFGGTLLGVSGLINAYKDAAKLALENATIREEFIMFEYRVEFDFDAMSPVMRVLKEYDAKIVSTAYEKKNEVVFQIKKLHSDKLESKFGELYATRLKFLQIC
jgi:uncharacterized YigZ family protein